MSTVRRMESEQRWTFGNYTESEAEIVTATRQLQSVSSVQKKHVKDSAKKA